jgi:hypothetical protein
MDIQFNDEEFRNCILVWMREIQSNTPAMSDERGVTYEYFLEYTKIEVNAFMENVNILIEQGLINKIADHRLTLSSKGKEYLGERNSIALSELSSLLMKKTYELYKRNNEDVSTQFNSMTLAILLGISNYQKIIMVVDELYKSGLIGKPAKTRYYANFLLSHDGIMYGENGSKKMDAVQRTTFTPIIVKDISGNVAINSENVTQSISTNDISQYCRDIERLIHENLTGKEKEDALIATATIEELSKAQQPNRGLIEVFLNNLDKIPILLSMVEKLKDALGF